MDKQDKWYSSNTSSGQSLIADEATGETIAVSYDVRNGNLLAAAPEMLAMLRKMIRACKALGSLPDRVEQLQAVIDKASE